jgi:hypothetical protein
VDFLLMPYLAWVSFKAVLNCTIEVNELLKSGGGALRGLQSGTPPLTVVYNLKQSESAGTKPTAEKPWYFNVGRSRVLNFDQP